MGWKKLLLTVFALNILVFTPTTTATADTTECSPRQSEVVGCDLPTHGGDARGDSVDVWARDGWGGGNGTGAGGGPGGPNPGTVSDGSGSGSGNGNGNSNGNSNSHSNNGGNDAARGAPGGPSTGGPPEIGCADGTACEVDSRPDVGCADGTACEVDLPPEPSVDQPPVVTVSDLVNFRPAAPVAAMEPSGWMLIGLDTNFIATASEHILSGQLLGLDAEVRFAPNAYRWHYGDGTSMTTLSPGATWAQLGVPEFSATATSHIYLERGSYTISLEVVYTAEYRFAGGSWNSITGTVASVADELTAFAGQAKTVLVQDDCLANPAGIGC